MPDELAPSTQEQQNTESSPDPAAIANAAASAHIKRFMEKTLPGLMQSAIGEALKNFQPPAPKHEPEEEGKPKKVSPEVAALQQQLAEAKAAAQKLADDHAAQLRKVRSDRAMVDLRQNLMGSVKPELVELLAGHLFSNVTFDEDGTPLFKTKVKTGYGFEDDAELPLKEGIEQYLKSESAKAYLPAPETTKVPPVRRPAATPGPVSQTLNPPQYEKMTDQQKIAAAAQLEAELAQLLNSRS